MAYKQIKLSDKQNVRWSERLEKMRLNIDNIIINQEYIFLKSGISITKKNLKKPLTLKYIKQEQDGNYIKYYFEKTNGIKVVKFDFELKHNLYPFSDNNFRILSEYFVKKISFYFEHQLIKSDLKFISEFHTKYPEYIL